MIVDVELTRRPNNNYVARVIQFPEVTIEAHSREAALTQMRDALVARRQAGTEIVQLTIDPVPAPATWPRHADAFPDDEAYHAMLTEVEQQRRVQDSDDSV